MNVPTGYVNLAHLRDIIGETSKHLGPEVAEFDYRLEPDSTGDPSVYFRLTLDDRFIHMDTLGELTSRLRHQLLESVRPLEDWGLNAYFRFRSQAEQEQARSLSR